MWLACALGVYNKVWNAFCFIVTGWEVLTLVACTATSTSSGLAIWDSYLAHRMYFKNIACYIGHVTSVTWSCYTYSASGFKLYSHSQSVKMFARQISTNVCNMYMHSLQKNLYIPLQTSSMLAIPLIAARFDDDRGSHRRIYLTWNFTGLQTLGGNDTDYVKMKLRQTHT